MTASNNDVTPQTGSCSFTVTVTEITTIGEVQGAVGAADNGLVHRRRSPRRPATAPARPFSSRASSTRRRSRTSAGANQFGIFIQNTAAEADGLPFTSDGIWIFMGAFSDILNVTAGQPAYVPQVGDEIVPAAP